MFYGAYSRSASYFERSIYAAEGLPSAEELALLEPYRDQLPAAVFEVPYIPPVSDGSGRDRTHLREAVRLLGDAGWTRDGSRLVDGRGEPLSVEFLINSKTFERVLGKYVEALKSIGVDATSRLVDPAQYQSRQNDFDFDILGAAFSLSATPMEGLKPFLTSEAADIQGSRNYAGIKEPVVDALIEKALAASDRQTHRTALSAIDRVLRAKHYVIPEWHSSDHRIALWDLFGAPETKPDYGFPVETTWWYDSQKAARIGKAQ
jgi:microcin C transport system substrate-binding protein